MLEAWTGTRHGNVRGKSDDCHRACDAPMAILKPGLQVLHISVKTRIAITVVVHDCQKGAVQYHTLIPQTASGFTVFLRGMGASWTFWKMI